MTDTMQMYNGTPCMPWPGWISKQGYGRLSVKDRTCLAHRAVYRKVVGKIPDGMVLDHLCRNRSCVNPSHLEPVTSGVNTMRGEGAGAKNKRKTHCLRGHEFSAGNVYSRKGWRECKICKRELSRLHKAKKRKAAHS